MLSDHAPLELEVRLGLKAVVRPVVPEDKVRAEEAYRLLSPESRKNRFWNNTLHLSDNQLEHLTKPQDGDHHSWIAVEADPQSRLPGFGAASFWRDKADPKGAEFAATVLDQWQRQGIGTLLLSILWHEAWHLGIRHFWGIARLEHHAVCHWWESAGGVVETHPMHHELKMELSSPESFVSRRQYQLHIGSAEAELVEWFRKWHEVDFGDH